MTMTMMKRTNMNQQHQQGLSRCGVSSLNLSQLSLASSPPSAASSSSSLASSGSGWGSVHTRSAYADLSAFTTTTSHQETSASSLSQLQQHQSLNQGDYHQEEGDGWGYFVDTPDRPEWQ